MTSSATLTRCAKYGRHARSFDRLVLVVIHGKQFGGSEEITK
jgi:hypothetical protein